MPWHDYVFDAAQLGADGGLARYALTMRPWLSALALRRNSRVFHDQTALQVIDAVLADHQPQANWRFEDALARLQAVVDTQLGLEGPNFSNARTALQDTQHMLRRFAKERGLLQTTDAESADVVQPVEASGNQAPSFSGGAPATRAQALAQLRQVAEVFRRTEPHSPVAYLADKHAKWGGVPLHQWLRSVLKDQASLAQIEELLGVETPPPSDS